MPTFLYEKLEEMFSKEKFNEIFPETDVCLYGEGYGARIQKGGGNYIKDGVSFVLFDVKIGRFWLKGNDIEDLASQLGIDVVPIIFQGTLQNAVEITKRGFKSKWGNFQAEGMVLKPEIQLYNRMNERIITKVKAKDFKNEEKNV